MCVVCGVCVCACLYGSKCACSMCGCMCVCVCVSMHIYMYANKSNWIDEFWIGLNDLFSYISRFLIDLKVESETDIRIRIFQRRARTLKSGSIMAEVRNLLKSVKAGANWEYFLRRGLTQELSCETCLSYWNLSSSKKIAPQSFLWRITLPIAWKKWNIRNGDKNIVFS